MVVTSGSGFLLELVFLDGMISPAGGVSPSKICLETQHFTLRHVMDKLRFVSS